VARNKAYSFTYEFSRYHHTWIIKEDKKKTMFCMECGSYVYNVTPFGLKNAPTIFSMVVVVVREYIHKFP
jgi:hypothetical protein